MMVGVQDRGRVETCSQVERCYLNWYWSTRRRVSHMEAVIIQHLLSTELALMENECARKRVPCHTANDLLWEHTRVAKIQARLCTKPGRHSRASIVCVP